MKITYKDIKKSEEVRAYIQKADESLLSLGFTEHSFAHVTKVAELAGQILTILGYSEHEVELAKISGYLHDIGNVVNRIDHAQSGAVMAFRILDKMDMDPDDIATVVTAIGNHDESTAYPVNPIAAALIIADKTDVRRSRVRNRSTIQFDIHDRVNYSVTSSKVIVTKEEVCLDISIDTHVCELMEYFEIFLGRMMLCKKAAEALNIKFSLIINNQKMM
ncbi:MAG: HD domain-containing protein [Firmicutes bacterium]|nr:HD domain-containing protein [Bacillota bacterium]